MMKVAKTTLRSVLCAALFTLGTVSTFAWLIGFVDDETLRMTLDAGKEVPNGYAKTTN